MDIFLLTAAGSRLDLPPFTAWELRRTGSVPCDSFQGTCLWEGPPDPALREACRLLAEEGGERRFTGVVDECRFTWDRGGGALELAARGLAALLLDNGSPAMDYQLATLSDILRDHVKPLGLQVARADPFPAVPGFSVSSGSSRWQVLSRFTQCCGGEPFFDAAGALTVAAGWEGKLWQLGPRTAFTALAWRDKRYGVLSQVLVQDRRTQSSQTLQNEAFTAQGLRRSQVLLLPGKNSPGALARSGRALLEQSARQRFRLELTLPDLSPIGPGDRVELALENPRLTGFYRVLESRAVLDGKGLSTTLTLEGS